MKNYKIALLQFNEKGLTVKKEFYYYHDYTIALTYALQMVKSYLTVDALIKVFDEDNNALFSCHTQG